jgi:ABC-type transporter Mla MlaB component
MKKSKHTVNTQNDRTQTGNGNVFLEGELTIAQAGQLRNDLNEVLKKHDTVKVTVQNVTSMDLTCIQLVYAFMKTCTQQNKKALLDIKLDSDLEVLLTKCGLKFNRQ